MVIFEADLDNEKDKRERRIKSRRRDRDGVIGSNTDNSDHEDRWLSSKPLKKQKLAQSKKKDKNKSNEDKEQMSYWDDIASTPDDELDEYETYYEKS